MMYYFSITELKIMDLKEKLEKKLSELKSDERLTYPTSNMFVNAPLSKFPLKPKL